MAYTISSRGRPIGTTELDFVRFDGTARSGWFHPNAFGEGLMPTVETVLPAIRALLDRKMDGEDGRPLMQESLRRSSEFADYAEALHRAGAMELTLHRPDGTLVPTSLIGLQDTHQLLELADEQEGRPLSDVLDGTEEWMRELESELEGSDDCLESVDELFDCCTDEGWSPDEEQIEFPRYQVHVLLSEENAIP